MARNCTFVPGRRLTSDGTTWTWATSFSGAIAAAFGGDRAGSVAALWPFLPMQISCSVVVK
jgi:hypothetical protein